jgi:hypothetical protein
MKIKQSIFIVSALMIFSTSFGQGVSKHGVKTPVIVAESGIKTINASNNIDLLLLNANDDDDIKASVPRSSLDKVKITYNRGNLTIAVKGFLPREERIPVYVYVDELEVLNLSGNASVFSRDILDLRSLKVNILDDAKVALRSRGKMKVNAPDNYHRIEEERYHLLLSTD